MIDVLRKLWTGEMVTHEGAFYRFDALESNPVPPARIPIWVGGISDAALRRASRNDGWLSDLQSTAEIESASRRCAVPRGAGPRKRAARRDGERERRVHVEGYRRLAQVGVTHVLTLPWVFTARRYEGAAREEGWHAPVRGRRDRKDVR
jgi:hypothetical protein